jgi:flagellar basal-body rod protein FlgB
MSTNPINGLFDSVTRGLEKNLDLTWRRNQAIVSNIANAETPQYRAVDVDFSSELDRAFKQSNQSLGPIAQTDARHLDTLHNSGAHTIADLSGATRGDGNNVDIDVQMGKLALNSGRFSLSANILYKKLSTLLTAIRQA